MAFDNDTGREVAWNVISFSHLSRSERKRIDAEIQIAKSLDHPRILRFVSAWINREKEEVVFITERVSGGSLRAYIARLDGPLKMKVIKNWCKQILEGISYLHGQPNPVIHRDLKCDNIFINGNDGKVLIGDLGLSTSLRGAASCATSIVGTPEFMAPELYEEKYGPPVDIYAFGMCLLEMVSRRYPYAECTTPGQIYKKVIASERPQVLSRVKDEALRHLIEVCLDTNPDNRPTAVEMLADPYWSEMEEGDKLAEIEEEPEPEPKEAPAVRAPRSGAYHTEAEVRRANAAKALPRSALLAHPNVVEGPTDDTLMLLSSPKSSRVTAEMMVTSDVLTYCRRKSIDRVEKVHLILELTEGKFHNVIFDFNALTDHPLIIGTELRDAGLVWQGVSEDELVEQIGKAIMDRISELHNNVVNSFTSSVNELEDEVVRADSAVSMPVLEAPALPTIESQSSTGTVVRDPPTQMSPGASFSLVVEQGSKRPPLHPPTQSPPTRSSLESVPGSVSTPKPSGSVASLTSTIRRNSSQAAFEEGAPPQYVLLSRETCAHLTESREEVPQFLAPRASVDSGVHFLQAPSTRQGSICSSLDETSSFTLSNWPSSIPPAGPRTPTADDVKQVQQMLAVVMVSERARIASFTPGVYCAFTEDTVKDLQVNNGLEVSGDVDDRTWELLREQVEYRKHKEEERGHKREEAQRKAKVEQEKKLQQQKRDSEQTMANLMAKMLSSIGGAPISPTGTPASALLADEPNFPPKDEQ